MALATMLTAESVSVQNAVEDAEEREHLDHQEGCESDTD
jgi:hypothetical protein